MLYESEGQVKVISEATVLLSHNHLGVAVSEATVLLSHNHWGVAVSEATVLLSQYHWGVAVSEAKGRMFKETENSLL